MLRPCWQRLPSHRDVQPFLSEELKAQTGEGDVVRMSTYSVSASKGGLGASALDGTLMNALLLASAARTMLRLASGSVRNEIVPDKANHART